MTEYEVLYDGSRNCLRCGAGMSREDDPHRHRCDTTAPLLRAERDTLKARCERLVELLREVIEPGVFGPWREVQDPALIESNLDQLCEQKGYGAVLHHVAWLWQQRHPGSAHTVAASHDGRMRIIREIQAELDAIDKADSKDTPS